MSGAPAFLRMAWGRVRDALSPHRPWVYLVYLSFFFFQWFFHPPQGNEFWLSMAGVAAFLVLYGFGAYRTGLSALPFIAGIAAVCYLLAPYNYGAGVFWIFAASITGRLRPTALVLGAFFALLASLLIYSYAASMPIPFWAPISLIGALTAMSVFYGMRLQNRTEELRLSQDQARALAAQTERERIARDLHDILGHTLSLIAIKADLAAKLFDRDRDKSRAEIGDIAAISRDALAQVRDAVSGMRMSLLAQEIAQARMTLEAADIVLETRVDAGELGPAAESAAALALREAVTNVVRHSAAGRCVITAEREGAALRLSVSDDGRGGEIRKGNGLAGMTDRVAELGGSVAVDGSEGVRVEIFIPNAGEGAS